MVSSKFLFGFGAAIALGLGAIACSPTTPAGPEPIDSPPGAASPSPVSMTAGDRPSTQTVKDPWTQQDVTLKLFEQPGVPVTTYYAEETFEVRATSAGEGTSIQFSGQGPENAYVQVYVPRENSSVAEMEERVSGANGLVETNGWQVTSSNGPRAYPWVQQRVDFEADYNAQQNIMGTVYVGEMNGQAFTATVHYPADAGDGFAPQAGQILENLQVVPR